MATLEVSGEQVEVVLGWLERLGALRGGGVSVALADVVDVQTWEAPFRKLHGLRAPGTGVPGLIALGTWRYRGGKDFVAVYRRQAAVIVDVRPGRGFRRLIVGVGDPEGKAAELRSACSAAVAAEDGPPPA
jgi:hypothetical protein